MWLGLFVLWLVRKSSAYLNVKDLRIPKKRFVLLVLQWCSANFGMIKHPYQLKIYYYKNKNISGQFLYWNKQIIVYMYPDLGLIELTDTIIHEYIHHLQFQKKSTEKDYNKEHKDKGYLKNPYEVEARKLAKKHTDECFKWVMNKI